MLSEGRKPRGESIGLEVELLGEALRLLFVGKRIGGKLFDLFVERAERLKFLNEGMVAVPSIKHALADFAKLRPKLGVGLGRQKRRIGRAREPLLPDGKNVPKNLKLFLKTPRSRFGRLRLLGGCSRLSALGFVLPLLIGRESIRAPEALRIRSFKRERGQCRSGRPARRFRQIESVLERLLKRFKEHALCCFLGRGLVRGSEDGGEILKRIFGLLDGRAALSPALEPSPLAGSEFCGFG